MVVATSIPLLDRHVLCVPLLQLAQAGEPGVNALLVSMSEMPVAHIFYCAWLKTQVETCPLTGTSRDGCTFGLEVIRCVACPNVCRRQNINAWHTAIV